MKEDFCYTKPKKELSINSSTFTDDTWQQKKLIKRFIFSTRDILFEEVFQMEQVPLLRWQTVWENFSSGKYPLV